MILGKDIFFTHYNDVTRGASQHERTCPLQGRLRRCGDTNTHSPLRGLYLTWGWSASVPTMDFHSAMDAWLRILFDAHLDHVRHASTHAVHV